MEGGFAATPVLALAFTAVIALGLWGTINFIFGGKSSYGSIFAVTMYAFLPRIIQTILGTAVIYAGAAPESFNLNAFSPTSMGAFLNPVETNKALYTLATWLDLTSIWSMACWHRHCRCCRGQAHFGLHRGIRLVGSHYPHQRGMDSRLQLEPASAGSNEPTARSSSSLRAVLRSDH